MTCWTLEPSCADPTVWLLLILLFVVLVIASWGWWL